MPIPFIIYLVLLGTNKIKIGHISRRPAIIVKESKTFEKGLKKAKLPEGPTISSPGPILFIVAATAETAVRKLFVSRQIRSTTIVNKMA